MKIRYTLAAAAIVITGAAGWWVWNRWFTERADPSAEIYTVRGIDISAHNGNVNFQALRRQGVAFAYIKATEGTDFIDRRFVDKSLQAHTISSASTPTARCRRGTSSEPSKGADSAFRRPSTLKSGATTKPSLQRASEPLCEPLCACFPRKAIIR